MFNVLEGGVSEPISWGKENLTNERSIIILDESNQVVWLWHGSMQGLVARRTALRQAESLKGHGYTVGKSIIGRDIKSIREIDQRKIGRDPTTDEEYAELEKLLNSKCKELDNFVVTFDLMEKEPITEKKVREEPVVSQPIKKIEPIKQAEPIKVVETEPIKKEPRPTISKPEIRPASEYDVKPVIDQDIASPDVKLPAIEPKPILSAPKLDLELEAKIGFVLVGIMEHYDDIWVSKKSDGSYSVEMMDGPICSFKVTEGSKISFSSDSFKGISTNVKTEIQKRFVELGKLIGK
jgi:hypothetical protein